MREITRRMTLKVISKMASRTRARGKRMVMRSGETQEGPRMITKMGSKRGNLGSHWPEAGLV